MIEEVVCSTESIANWIAWIAYTFMVSSNPLYKVFIGACPVFNCPSYEVSTKAIPTKYAVIDENQNIRYDGFELIRQYLDDLSKSIQSEESGLDYSDKINDWLISRVDAEIKKLSDRNSAINLARTYKGRFYPNAIPE